MKIRVRIKKVGAGGNKWLLVRNKLLVSNTHHSKKQNKTKTNKKATLTLNKGNQAILCYPASRVSFDHPR